MDIEKYGDRIDIAVDKGMSRDDVERHLRTLEEAYLAMKERTATYQDFQVRFEQTFAAFVLPDEFSDDVYTSISNAEMMLSLFFNGTGTPETIFTAYVMLALDFVESCLLDGLMESVTAFCEAVLVIAPSIREEILPEIPENLQDDLHEIWKSKTVNEVLESFPEEAFE